ncbi:MAG: zinc ribbon domain-containing protein, partial [Candidatus Saccharimonadales bacterium]
MNTGKLYKPLLVALIVLAIVGALAVFMIFDEALLRGGCISVAGMGYGWSDVIIPAYYVLCAVPLIICFILFRSATKKLRNEEIAPENRKLIWFSGILMVFLVVYPIPTRELLLMVRGGMIGGSKLEVVWLDGYTCEIKGEFDSGTTCESNYPEAHPAYVGRLYGKYPVGVDVYFADTASGAGNPKYFVYISRYVPNGTPVMSESDKYRSVTDEWMCDKDKCKHKLKTRRLGRHKRSNSSPFAAKIICGECGGFYGSKVWHSADQYRTHIWQCNRKYKDKTFCSTPHIREDVFKQDFIEAFNQILGDK